MGKIKRILAHARAGLAGVSVGVFAWLAAALAAGLLGGALGLSMAAPTHGPAFHERIEMLELRARRLVSAPLSAISGAPDQDLAPFARRAGRLGNDLRELVIEERLARRLPRTELERLALATRTFEDAARLAADEDLAAAAAVDGLDAAAQALARLGHAAEALAPHEAHGPPAAWPFWTVGGLIALGAGVIFWRARAAQIVEPDQEDEAPAPDETEAAEETPAPEVPLAPIPMAIPMAIPGLEVAAEDEAPQEEETQPPEEAAEEPPAPEPAEPEPAPEPESPPAPQPVVAIPIALDLNLGGADDQAEGEDSEEAAEEPAAEQPAEPEAEAEAEAEADDAPPDAEPPSAVEAETSEPEPEAADDVVEAAPPEESEKAGEPEMWGAAEDESGETAEAAPAPSEPEKPGEAEMWGDDEPSDPPPAPLADAAQAAEEDMADAAEATEQAAEKALSGLEAEELRGPLKGVLGLLEALSEYLPPEQAPALQEAERAVARVAQMMEAGERDPEGDLSPAEMVAHLDELFAPAARLNGVEFEVEALTDEFARLGPEGRKFERALAQLCAMVMERKGVSALKLQVSEEEGEYRAGLSFAVEGEPEAVAAEIDEEINQSPEDGEEEVGALLAKGLLERIGGRLEVSTTDSGRVLILAAAPAGKEESAPPQGPRVRIVARTRSLGAIGAAAAAARGVEVVDSGDAMAPDVILVEAGGEEEAAAIAEARELAPNAALIALGAPVDASVFAAQAPSPMDPDQVVQLVNEVWAASKAAGEAAQ